MGVDIIRGISKKPVASDALADSISSLPLNGFLFIGYPIIRTSEGPSTLDALLVSKEKGIVAFDLIEGNDAENYYLRQDDSANRLESLLKTHRELVERRKLLIPIHTISFAPAISGRRLPRGKHDCPVANSNTLLEKLYGLESWRGGRKADDIYEKSLSVLQNVSNIRKNTRRRVVANKDSRGAKLKKLEDSIATLDQQQNRAAIETVSGVQRIRGLAGSGKTIILALKAAYLHIQHPDWRIAVTFYTRSLKDHFRQLITKFTLDLTHEEPNWDNVGILHAWGDKDRGGIYRNLCMVHDLRYFDFNAAKGFGQGKEFVGACKDALDNCEEFKRIYDVILVDEAQDLPPEFLRICYHLLDEKKMLIYAYDELQNLSGESLPSPGEIFGKDSSGSPLVTLDESSNSDIVLKKCYRNSRPVLTAAHALGFGIYREPNGQGTARLVQMFDDPRFWKDVGYKVKRGSLSLGEHVILHRTSVTSPRFLENHSPTEDLVKFKCFNNQQEQTEWLAKNIKSNLESEELRHEDIIVINPNPLTTRSNVRSVRRHLLEIGIDNHIAGVDTDLDIFYKAENSITFTGVHRAKGNEAGMVYIINAQECCFGALTGLNLARARNQLFTAITRSKAWVRVLGVGDGMRELKDEYDRLKANGFRLEFDYPTKEEIGNLRVVHRDVSGEEIKQIEESGNNLSRLVDDIESGKFHLEDLDKSVVTRFKELLEVDE